LLHFLHPGGVERPLGGPDDVVDDPEPGQQAVAEAERIVDQEPVRVPLPFAKIALALPRPIALERAADRFLFHVPAQAEGEADPLRSDPGERKGPGAAAAQDDGKDPGEHQLIHHFSIVIYVFYHKDDPGRNPAFYNGLLIKECRRRAIGSSPLPVKCFFYIIPA